MFKIFFKRRKRRDRFISNQDVPRIKKLIPLFKRNSYKANH